MISPEKFENHYRVESEPVALDLSEQTRPRLYLDYAVQDLEHSEKARSLVNAVSNAKRALHYQVDILSEAFGLLQAGLNKKIPFPKKIEFCKACGLVGPRILKKLNRLRNVVEHDYYIPKEDEAEDFVDVVELFLAATDMMIHSFTTRIGLETDDQDFHGCSKSHLRIEFKPGSGSLKLTVNEFAGDDDLWHKEAKKERDRLNKNIIKQGEKGIEVVLIDSIDQTAYRKAYNSNRKITHYDVRAEEGEIYFKWVKFLNVKKYEVY